MTLEKMQTLATEVRFKVLKKGKPSEFNQKDIQHDKPTPLGIKSGSKRKRTNDVFCIDVIF